MDAKIGSIVWYFENGIYLAAIVTVIYPGNVVDLHVFDPNGLKDAKIIAYSDPPQDGCWSWPV